VTCGNGNGTGSLLVYSLPNSASGFNLTNLTVYGGWADAGRDQQAYTVYYSTVLAPTNFIALTSVNFNPVNPAGVQSATRVMLSSATGALATNVTAVKFDFTSPTSENGYCGYAGITVFGTASAIPASTLGVALLVGQAGFVINLDGLIPGQSYLLQSTTNLAAASWYPETNFVASQATLAWTNSTATVPQKFYRVVTN
jgi:hypothetical protein